MEGGPGEGRGADGRAGVRACASVQMLYVHMAVLVGSLVRSCPLNNCVCTKACLFVWPCLCVPPCRSGKVKLRHTEELV